MISENLLNVLKQPPLGLVFDIDGTLSPFAPTPGEAKLYPGVACHLQQASNYACIGIMTGRDINDGAKMVNVENIIYVGCHGLEWCEGLPTTHQIELIPEALQYVRPGKQLLDLAEQQLTTAIPGLIIQRKSIGGTLHYRLAPDPKQTHTHILSTLQEPTRQLNMQLGESKFGVEILTPLTINKGSALRSFVKRYGLRSLIFAGDDYTDLYGILEMEHLQQEGFVTHSIAVQHQDTPLALLEHADTIVQGVEGMVQLLEKIIVLLIIINL